MTSGGVDQTDELQCDTCGDRCPHCGNVAIYMERDKDAVCRLPICWECKEDETRKTKECECDGSSDGSIDGSGDENEGDEGDEEEEEEEEVKDELAHGLIDRSLSTHGIKVADTPVKSTFTAKLDELLKIPTRKSQVDAMIAVDEIGKEKEKPPTEDDEKKKNNKQAHAKPKAETKATKMKKARKT